MTGRVAAAGDRLLEGREEEADGHREARRLGADREERGERGGRALVDVGAPHVERHAGDLVADAGEHEDDRHHQRELRRRLPAEGVREEEAAGDVGKLRADAAAPVTRVMPKRP